MAVSKQAIREALVSDNTRSTRAKKAPVRRGKMSKPTYRRLKRGIRGVFRHIAREENVTLQAAAISSMYKYKDEGMTPMRFRWDLFWAATGRIVHSLPSTFLLDTLHNEENLTDDHIDTALRAVMREHDLTWAAKHNS